MRVSKFKDNFRQFKNKKTQIKIKKDTNPLNRFVSFLISIGIFGYKVRKYII